MLIQLYDVVGTFVYCGIATFVILKVIDWTIGLRVSNEVEVEGLDINLHGETVSRLNIRQKLDTNNHGEAFFASPFFCFMARTRPDRLPPVVIAA